MSIGSVYLTYSGSVEIMNLYVGASPSDTIASFGKLNTGVSILPLLKGDIQVSHLQLQGLVLNLSQGKDSVFNYQFILDGLGASADADSKSAASDSSTTLPSISIGPLSLTNCRITYRDSILGINLSSRISELHAQPGNTDLEELNLEIYELSLVGSETSYEQFLPMPASDDTATVAMPFITCKSIRLEDNHFRYTSRPDEQSMQVDLPDFMARDLRLNLPESAIDLDEMTVDGLVFDLRLPEPNPELSPQDSATVPFKLPAWNIDLSGVEISNTSLNYQLGEHQPKPSFDPSNLRVRQLHLALGHTHYSPEEITLNLADLALVLNDKFSLARASASLSADKDQLSVSEFDLQTAGSELKAALGLRFGNLTDWLNQPSRFESVDLSLPSTRLDLQELLFFQPELDTIEYFRILAREPVLLSGTASGTLAELMLDNFRIAILRDTEAKITGNINGLPDSEDLSYNLSRLKFHTARSDMAMLLDTSGMVLPDSVDLQAKLRGSTDDLNGTIALATDLGNANGKIDVGGFSGELRYEADLSLIDLNLARLAGVSDLEPVSAGLSLHGKGVDPSTMAAEMFLDFQKLVYRGYDYQDLIVEGSLENSLLSACANHSTEELRFDLFSEGELSESFTSIDLKLALEGAHLADLMLTDYDYKVAGDIHSHFNLAGKQMNITGDLRRVQMIMGSDTYRLDSVFMEYQDAPDSSAIKLYSDLSRAELMANCSMSQFMNNLKYYGGWVLDSGAVNDLDDTDFRMSARAELWPHPIISEVLLPSLEDYDTLKMSAKFNPESDDLQAVVSFPDLTYGPRRLKNLNLDLKSNPDSSHLSLNFDGIDGPFINMGPTSLMLQRVGQEGHGRLHVINDEDKTDYHLEARYHREAEHNHLNILKDSLILNQLRWNIADNNRISWGSSHLEVLNFTLRQDGESLEVSTSPENPDQLSFSFSQFDLNVLFGILNNDQDLISGKLNGDINLVDIQDVPGFSADLALNQLAVTGAELGTLSLEAEDAPGQKFTMDLELQGPQIQFAANGDFTTDPLKRDMNLEVMLDHLNLRLLQELFPSYLDSARGSITLDLDINGDLTKPEYRGDLGFKNAGLLLPQLGTYLSLENERLSLDNSGLAFSNFRVRDPRGSVISLDGKINTENTLNPSFDLKLKADNFQLLKAEPGVNELYYGEVRGDLDIKVTGDAALPVIRSRVVLRDETDFIYLVPASQAQLESRSGIVVFEDMQDTSGLMQPEKIEGSSSLKGLDLESRIILRNGTQLSMILDQRTGDRLSIKGASDLEFVMSPNGNMSLTGIYELNDGGYKLNLYDLVKKEFKIRSGSKVIWTGAPMGAELNIVAAYETRTSAASLMDDPDPMYNRTLPFEVLLYIKGTVDQPEISFKLDMPPDSRGAIAGDVYGKLKQVNQDESELNKQVFALIVFDRFIPSSESGDAGVSTADIALSSVSDFMSAQLNNFSQKYLQGVELDVNIENYTDYGMGAGQQRTDLNVSMRKAFFDDRFVVEVGSNVALQGYNTTNDVVGDVALEYKLTEEGTYRLRGYRRSDFENPIEGQVIITGLALIFTREFDHWNELFVIPESQDSTVTDKLPPNEE